MTEQNKTFPKAWHKIVGGIVLSGVLIAAGISPEKFKEVFDAVISVFGN